MWTNHGYGAPGQIWRVLLGLGGKTGFEATLRASGIWFLPQLGPSKETARNQAAPTHMKWRLVSNLLGAE
jgi:hypothetical protein